VRLVLEPGLTIGVFHADPHAGDLLLTENGALGVLDFGKVGKLTPRDRHQILAAFLAIGSRDADRLTTALLGLSDGAGVGNDDELSLRIGALLDRYADAAIGKIGFEQAMADLIGLFWSHSLVMPGRIILFFKALSMSEGLIRTIEPDARFGQLLAPVMKRVLLERIIGAEALHRLASWAFHTGAALADLPARGDAALTAATTGELRVRTQLEELAPALSRVEAMVDRLSAAVLVAAAIIGLALLVQVYRPQLPSGIAAVAWV
jgi:ubiquinone biosynthesis protein